MADKATGDISAPNQETGESDAPSYVTKEELSQIVNAAISNRNKSFEKKFEEFTSGFKDLMQAKPVEEVKASAKQSDPELARALRELEAIKKERDLEKAQGRDLKLRSTVKDELAKLGIQSPTSLKAAMAILLDADKAVGYEEDEIVFRTEEGATDLASGLKAWAKTEDAKFFLPPKGASGSGSKPEGNKVAPKGTEQSLSQLMLSSILRDK
jgi:hypothetical protein